MTLKFWRGLKVDIFAPDWAGRQAAGFYRVTAGLLNGLRVLAGPAGFAYFKRWREYDIAKFKTNDGRQGGGFAILPLAFPPVAGVRGLS